MWWWGVHKLLAMGRVLWIDNVNTVLQTTSPDCNLDMHHFRPGDSGSSFASTHRLHGWFWGYSSFTSTCGLRHVCSCRLLGERYIIIPHWICKNKTLDKSVEVMDPQVLEKLIVIFFFPTKWWLSIAMKRESRGTWPFRKGMWSTWPRRTMTAGVRASWMEWRGSSL